MKTSWTVLLISLGALACKKKPLMAATYNGTIAEHARVQQDLGAGPNGTTNVQWWDTDRPRTDVRVEVSPAGGERFGRYRIALPGCTVVAEMSDEHNGSLVASPLQTCQIRVDHFDGGLTVTGNVVSDGPTGQLTVMVTGNNNQVSPHVLWTLQYVAQPAP